MEVVWRSGTLVMDEPESQSVGGQGPDPYTTFLASLAGCTLATLRMYVDRKAWPVPHIKVRMNMYQEQDPIRTIIRREIIFPDSVSEDQRNRLLVVAKSCPVSRILENSIAIETTS